MIDAENLHVERPGQWRSWLRRHHATSSGVWVVTWRAGTGRPAPTYEELVEEAVAWGWVDSRPGRVDAERTRLYFAPRRPGSAWSASNKRRVAKLEAEGRLQPAGRRLVELAQSSGTWSQLDRVEALEVPADLAGALARRRGARANFDAFPRSVRRSILEWIETAKRPETRERRVAETAERAARNERANQWRAT